MSTKNSLENHENVVPTLYSANTWQMYFPPPILCISPKWLLLLQRKQKWYYLEAFFLTSQSSLYTVIQTTSQCSIRDNLKPVKREILLRWDLYFNFFGSPLSVACIVVKCTGIGYHLVSFSTNHVRLFQSSRDREREREDTRKDTPSHYCFTYYIDWFSNSVGTSVEVLQK